MRLQTHDATRPLLFAVNFGSLNAPSGIREACVEGQHDVHAMSEPVLGTAPPSGPDSTWGSKGPRGRALTIVLAILTIAMVILSIVLVVFYTVPLKKVERTDAYWFGGNLVTISVAPASAHFYLDAGFFCTPSNAIGNLTISLVWESSDANTTARMLWITGGPPTVNHVIYWVNNTSQGGYSFPPTLSNYLCETSNPITCVWVTSQPGVLITLTGVQEYNYTATVPLW